MNYKNDEVCIICGNTIYRTKSKNYRSIKTLRSRTSVTCGKECSKIYNRLPDKIRKLVKAAYEMNNRKQEINPASLYAIQKTTVSEPAGLSSSLINN